MKRDDDYDDGDIDDEDDDDDDNGVYITNTDYKCECFSQMATFYLYIQTSSDMTCFANTPLCRWLEQLRIVDVREKMKEIVSTEYLFCRFSTQWSNSIHSVSICGDNAFKLKIN